MEKHIDPYYYERISNVHKKAHLDHSFRLMELRKILESIFTDLTRHEKKPLSNTFSRIVYICDKYHLNRSIQNHIHKVRTLFNKLAHDSETKADRDDYDHAIGVLVNLVSLFSNGPIPDHLREYSDRLMDAFDIQVLHKTENAEQIAFAKALVTEKTNIRKDSSGIDFFAITCESETLGTFRLYLRDIISRYSTTGDRYLLLWDMINKYSEINIFNIKNTKKNNYTITPETIIIIEPDFLIDVTDISGCFNNRGNNSLISLMSKLVPKKTTKQMLQGIIINDIFDEMVFYPDSKTIDTIKSSVFQNILLSLSVGLKGIREIIDNIDQNHSKTLKKVIKAKFSNGPDKKTIKLEPSFLSTDYGLQGRLDALLHYKDTGECDIIELKSGSSPDYGVWENHKIQVICYNMLLKKIYHNRKGRDHILYSSSFDNPLREVPGIISTEKDISMIRNQIINIIFSLANGNYKFLSQINPVDFGDCPPYLDSEISLFNYSYNNAGPILKAYYNTFLSFLLRELIVTKVGTVDRENDRYEGFAQLWKADFEAKAESYNIISDLEFLDIDQTSSEISLRLKKDRISNFRKGDIIILYPQQKDNSFPLDKELLRGTITSISEETVTVLLKNGSKIHDIFNSSDHWAIEHDYFESGYFNLCQSLYEFLGAEKKTRELLLGMRKPGATDDIPPGSLKYLDGLYSKGMITATQRSILTSMLKAKDYFLLQGPPGTGKTSIILLNLAKILTDLYNENIALLAFTNRAVDEICEKLKKSNIDFIRLGGNYSNDGHNLAGKIKGKRLRDINKMLKDTPIFVSTVSTFNSRKRDLSKIKTFDSVIVDEASQLLEPQLIGLLIHFKRFFLIGDQNQLPPISAQNDEACMTGNKELNALGIIDLRTSLFERLYTLNYKKGWTGSIAMLQDQYRMHENIASLINHYYNDCLIPQLEEQKETINIFYDRQVNDICKILALSRTVFIESKIDPNPKTNTEEAIRSALIIRTIEEIYGDSFNENTVGVITPWRAQANEIRKFLPDCLKEMVTVDTVERFQGSERDIIIYSLSVCHRSQLFLMSNTLSNAAFAERVDRKLNVAVSRARKNIIFLGNTQVISENRHFSFIIDKIKKSNGYITNKDADQVFCKYFDIKSPQDNYDISIWSK